MDYKVKFIQDIVDKLTFNPRVVGQNPDGSLITEPLPPKTAYYFISDLALSGFKIRVYEHTKTYYAIKKIGTHQRCVFKIGSCDHIKLEGKSGARAAALSALSLMSQGKNPNLQKNESASLEEAKKERLKFTFGVAFVDYKNSRSSGNKFSKATQNDHEQVVTKLGKSTLWKTPFDDITPEMIQKALAPLYEMSASTGNKFMRYCRAAWTRSALLKNKDKMASVSPFKQWAKAFPPPKTPRRETYLATESEKGKIWLRTIAEARHSTLFSHRVFGDFLLLTLLWGTRRGEGTSLHDTHIFFEEKAVVCRETKSGRDHWIPLTPLAEEILRNRLADNQKPRNIKKQPRDHGGWVFPSRIARKHIIEPDKLLDLANETSALKINLHDLRRTFSGEMWGLVKDSLTVKLAMNHSTNDDVTVGYLMVKPKLDMLRPFFEQREKWLFELAGVTKMDSAENGVDGR